jgi:hypothetical protein
MSNRLEFTAFLKDMMSGPLSQLKSKSTVAYNSIKSSFGKIAQESRVATMSIDQINRRLDELNRTRRISVDLRQIRSANAEIQRLKIQKTKMETATAESPGMGGFAAAGVAGLIIGGVMKAVGFARGALEEWNQGQQAEAQVKASLISTKGVSGKQYGDLQNQADKLQDVTLFENDVTLKAQSILLTFTKVRGEIYDRAIPAIQDMATKMGTDLNSATLQVGKALNDPIQGVNALRRAGVQLDDQQKKLIETYVKSGQIQKAQEIILKELNTEFGGSAQAAAKAGTGGMTQLNNKFKDLKEQSGALLGPLVELSGGLGKVIDKAKEYITVPMSLHMQSEQSEVNALARTLMDSQLPQEIRLQNYNRLNQIAPEVLKNLDAENINVQQLAANLEAYNTQMKYKIAYQANQEKIAPHIKYQEDLAAQLNKAEQSFVDKMRGFDDETIARGTKSRVYFDEMLKRSKNFLWAAEMTADMATQQNEKFGNILTNKVIEMRDITKLMKGSSGVVQDMWANFNKYNPIPEGMEADPTNPYKELEKINSLSGDYAKQKNINIYITNLNEGGINVHAATVKESGTEIKDEVTKILLTAINDANRVDV